MSYPGALDGFDDREDNLYAFRPRRFAIIPVMIALILSTAALAAAFVVMGRYTTVRPAQGVIIYEIDRFTGNVRLCSASGCRDLPLNPKEPDDWGVGVPVPDPTFTHAPNRR